MTKEQAEFLAAASEDAGCACDIREHYSGRGMYGRSTYAVVVNSELELLSNCINYLNQLDWNEDTRIPAFSGLRHDSMGRGVVIY